MMPTMTQPTEPRDGGTLSTGLATVQVVQDGSGTATLVVNGTDLSKAARRVVLDVDGRGPARVTVALQAGASFEGPGVVQVASDPPPSLGGARPVEDVQQLLAELPWQGILTEAMQGTLDDSPQDRLRDLVMEEVSERWEQGPTGGN
jgi:hypothetical protein